MKSPAIQSIKSIREASVVEQSENRQQLVSINIRYCDYKLINYLVYKI